MLGRIRLNYVVQVTVILLWALLVIGGEHFQMYGLVRVSTSLLVFGAGIFLVIKRYALASSMYAAEEAMRQKAVWPWMSVQGWNLKAREAFLQIIGWIFVIFGILGCFGLIQVGAQ